MCMCMYLLPTSLQSTNLMSIVHCTVYMYCVLWGRWTCTHVHVHVQEAVVHVDDGSLYGDIQYIYIYTYIHVHVHVLHQTCTMYMYYTYMYIHMEGIYICTSMYPLWLSLSLVLNFAFPSSSILHTVFSSPASLNGSFLSRYKSYVYIIMQCRYKIMYMLRVSPVHHLV